MSEVNQTMPSSEVVEQELRAQLAQGDVVLATAQPVLRHLLAQDDPGLFSDEVIARIRGMMLHLAQQLLLALAEEAEAGDPGTFVAERHEDMAQELLQDPAMLRHVHALTIEALLAERLQWRAAIDPVLSPWLQELAADADSSVAGSAMRLIAAQARFLQQQRRMELAVGELPGELFHAATRLLRAHDPALSEAGGRASHGLRARYNEADSRLGQIARLLMELRRRDEQALAVEQAGLSIFVNALASASRQDRETMVLSLGESQRVRLALALRAAGLDDARLTGQFLYLHPDLRVPEGIAGLPIDRAAGLLADAGFEAVG